MFDEKIWISKFWIVCKAITKEDQGNHYFLVLMLRLRSILDISEIEIVIR